MATFLKKVTPYDVGGVKGQIKFVFGNGLEVVADLDKVSPENKEHAFVHGVSQRVGDGASGFSKDLEYGKAFDELTAIIENLYTPNWNRTRGEGGENRQIFEDLIVAISNMKKLPVDDVRVIVEAAPVEKLKKWLVSPTIKAEIADIKSKRLAALVKGDELDGDEFAEFNKKEEIPAEEPVEEVKKNKRNK